MSIHGKVDISREDLQDLFAARLLSDEKVQRKVQREVQLEMGRGPHEEGRKEMRLRGLIQRWMVELSAFRLLKNDPTIRLFSREDFFLFGPALLDELEEMEGEELGEGGRAAFLEQSQLFFSNAIGQTEDLLGGESYEEVWRWVKEALDVASLYNVPVGYVYLIPEAEVELRRRLMTREEFIQNAKRMVEKVAGVETIRTNAINIFLATLPSELRDREEIGRHMDEHSAQFEAASRTLKRVMLKHIDAETRRIYGS